MSLLDAIGELGDLDWATTTIFGMLDKLQGCALYIVSFIYDFFMDSVEQLADVSTRLDDMESIISFTTDVASLILVLVFLKLVFTNYVLDVDGESDIDPMQSMVNISFSLAVMNCGGEIHDILMKLSNLLKDGLMLAICESTVEETLTLHEAIFNVASKIISFMLIAVAEVTASATAAPLALGAGILAILWVVTIVVLLVVLICKILFRGVELFVFQILFPLFAVDIISPRKELWKSFFKSYLVTVFGYLVQYLCLQTAIALIFNGTTISADGFDVLWNPILATVLLYFACKAPKWLQQFTYTTGAGQTISSGTRSVTGMASGAVNTAMRFIH